MSLFLFVQEKKRWSGAQERMGNEVWCCSKGIAERWEDGVSTGWEEAVCSLPRSFSFIPQCELTYYCSPFLHPLSSVFSLFKSPQTFPPPFPYCDHWMDQTELCGALIVLNALWLLCTMHYCVFSSGHVVQWDETSFDLQQDEVQLRSCWES